MIIIYCLIFHAVDSCSFVAVHHLLQTTATFIVTRCPVFWNLISVALWLLILLLFIALFSNFVRTTYVLRLCVQDLFTLLCVAKLVYFTYCEILNSLALIHTASTASIHTKADNWFVFIVGSGVGLTISCAYIQNIFKVIIYLLQYNHNYLNVPHSTY